MSINSILTIYDRSSIVIFKRRTDSLSRTVTAQFSGQNRTILKSIFQHTNFHNYYSRRIHTFNLTDIGYHIYRKPINVETGVKTRNLEVQYYGQ